MPRKRHSREQILRKLREAEELRSQGTVTREICRHLEVSENTFQRWKQHYGGLEGRQKRRLAELEDQNFRLRQLVADLVLDLHAARTRAGLIDDNPVRALRLNGDTHSPSM